MVEVSWSSDGMDGRLSDRATRLRWSSSRRGGGGGGGEVNFTDGGPLNKVSAMSSNSLSCVRRDSEGSCSERSLTSSQ